MDIIHTYINSISLDGLDEVPSNVKYIGVDMESKKNILKSGVKKC